jgi:hypothetical protein
VLAPRPAGGPPDDTADRYVYDLYFRDATAAIPAGTGATLEGFVPDEGELVASDEEEVEEEDLGDEDSNGSWAAIGEDFKSAPLTLSHRRPSLQTRTSTGPSRCQQRPDQECPARADRESRTLQQRLPGRIQLAFRGRRVGG